MAGDAGIGKTRLVTELGARARATGAQTLVGRCIDLVIGKADLGSPDSPGADGLDGEAG